MLQNKKEIPKEYKPTGTSTTAYTTLLFRITECMANTAKTDSAPFAMPFAKPI